MNPSVWQPSRLADLLVPTCRSEQVVPSNEYRLLGIRLDGNGPFLRETKQGTEIAAGTLNRVEAGDFIYSRLFAWRGAFGVINPSLHGCYVSSEFPTFTPIAGRVDPHFLSYWFRLPQVLAKVAVDCSGSTPLTRNRFKEQFFLSLEIPLPPLPEQWRIVARIGALAAKVEEARRLREQSAQVSAGLIDSLMGRLWVRADAWQSQPLGQLVTISSGQVDPRLEPYASMPHVSGECIQSGTGRLLNYTTASEDGVTSGKYLFEAGSILYSKIRPYLRKAVETPFTGVCSADIYAFTVISPAIEPRFLMFSLIGQPFTEYANALSGRTRMPKVNQEQVMQYRLPYPGLAEQQGIVSKLDALVNTVSQLRHVMRQSAAEIERVLPSILDKAFQGEL